MNPGNPRHRQHQVLATCTLELDRPREARLTLGALMKYEQATGRSFFRPKQAPIETPSDMCALIWACCSEDDASLTRETVERYITAAAMETFAAALTRGSARVRQQSPRHTAGNN